MRVNVRVSVQHSRAIGRVAQPSIHVRDVVGISSAVGRAVEMDYEPRAQLPRLRLIGRAEVGVEPCEHSAGAAVLDVFGVDAHDVRATEVEGVVEALAIFPPRHGPLRFEASVPAAPIVSVPGTDHDGDRAAIGCRHAS